MNLETSNSPITLEQILMTLSAIAYTEPLTKFESQLANTSYATQGRWELVWGPADKTKTLVTGNLMYVAKHKLEANTYAVVVRGTVLSPQDIIEDLDIFETVPWQYPKVEGAVIAHGTSLGFETLLKLTDPNTGKTLGEFFTSIEGATIYVTGHSLGGCLASVLTLWLIDQFKQLEINQGQVIAYTFAAPTAGNQAFADYYRRLAGTSMRYYNTIDAIPMGWNNIASIMELFQGGIKCSPEYDLALGFIIYELETHGKSYAQVDVASPLTGEVTHASTFFEEMEAQHGHNTYLKLLGAPLVNNTITYGPVPGAVKRD